VSGQRESKEEEREDVRVEEASSQRRNHVSLLLPSPSVEEAQATTNLNWADIVEDESSVLPPSFESLATTKSAKLARMGVREARRTRTPSSPLPQSSCRLSPLVQRRASTMDGDWLPTSPPTRQLMPLVPDCLVETKRYWDKPLSLNARVKGLLGVDIVRMEELRLSSPPRWMDDGW